ncbi:MAG: magnesium protoporphyrin IX methyltransferase [Pseudomonadota bacterium]
MSDGTYQQTRQKLTTYFDQTASAAWAKLTSDAPVGRIRATVRAGRNEMRDTLLSWLPQDMRGLRLMDAGCGTGALSVIAAERGAEVLAVDVSPTLVELAAERTPAIAGSGTIDFRVGDMLDESFGAFDYVVAMDSLIHYQAEDIASTLAAIGKRTRRAMLFTVAPRTPMLTVMHTVGRLIPHREHRAPEIIPVSQNLLQSRFGEQEALDTFSLGRTHRVSSGFYKSLAMELTR